MFVVGKFRQATSAHRFPARPITFTKLPDPLATCNKSDPAARMCVSDIGVGANCVYPLIGNTEYGWRFLGVDIDEAALANAPNHFGQNPQCTVAIELDINPSGKTSSSVCCARERPLMSASVTALPQFASRRAFGQPAQMEKSRQAGRTKMRRNLGLILAVAAPSYGAQVANALFS